MSPVHHYPDEEKLLAMDLKPLRRQQPQRNSPRSLSAANSPRHSSPRPLSPAESAAAGHGGDFQAAKAERSLGSGMVRNLLALAAGSMLVLILLVLSGTHRSAPLDLLRSRARIKERAKLCDLDLQQLRLNDGLFESYAEPVKDKLFGGLLTTTFEEASCLSRYQLASYWKESSHKPSPYLVERLRKYEELHKKCGPNTELYRKAIEQLNSNSSSGSSECNYVVWLPADGLGNRIVTIIAAFLYALLNNKVLLLQLTDDLHDLFCEPFPDTSWILPSDFPLQNYDPYIGEIPQSYGNMLKENVLSNDRKMANVSLPAFVYIYLRHDNSDLDKMFYCEDAQMLLRRFPWLLLSSNQYFVPALFLISQYNKELNRLFPEKDTVFHHLGRYLLHPTNLVWGYITRYYESYLINANGSVGLQIRNFLHAPVPFDDMLAQVINCSLSEKLLPNINLKSDAKQMTGGARKAVLVTNLKSGFFEKLRNMYYEHPTITGELISVYQPSNEERQQIGDKNHNAKALSEMYLLSFADVLMTSEWSTFGYVAQGFGGLRPWILLKPDHHSPPCRRAMSMEPCFHFPQNYDCKSKTVIDKGLILPYLRHCEDVGQGLKLVSQAR